MLVIVSLLLANLITGHISNEPKMALAQGGIGFIACSDDAQYVFVYSGGTLFKSDDYGEEFHPIRANQFKSK